MKKIFTFILTYCVIFNVNAQFKHGCGVSAKLNNNGNETFGKRYKATPTIIADANTVYTIPVMFHVYHLGEAEGVGSNVSDAAIIASVARLNAVFSATGIHAGLLPDTKLRFELAKFTDSCQPTNGIKRIDGRTIPGYAENPVSYTDSEMHIKLNIASFTINHFLNIRIIHNTNNYGWAYYNGDMYMFAGSVNTSTTSYGWDSFWAHEMGHALSLAHTFEGSEAGVCPNNTNPETDGDGIADTEPHKDEYWDCTSVINNSCTGAMYGNNVLKNHMSYFDCSVLFTPNQIATMRNALLTNRAVFNTNINMFTLNQGYWNDPTIWSCGRVPTANDEVTISPFTNVYIPAGNFSVKKIFKQGDILLEAGATLTIKQN